MKITKQVTLFALTVLTVSLAVAMLTATTATQSRAEVQRRVKFLAGGPPEVAYRVQYACTDKVVVEMYVFAEPGNYPTYAEASIFAGGHGAAWGTPEQFDPDIGWWWLEVWNGYTQEYEARPFTHRFYAEIDQTDPGVQLGDRIMIWLDMNTVHWFDEMQTIIDCVDRDTQHTELQAPAVSSEFDPELPDCSTGTLLQQYTMEMTEPRIVETLDVALQGQWHHNIRAELSSPGPNHKTIILWDGMETGMGWRCHLPLEKDPLASLVLSDNTVYEHDYGGCDDCYPGNPALKPVEPLSLFQGEQAQGTWTLNICEVYPAAPLNGDFENGPVEWDEFSSNGWPLIYDAANMPVGPHDGSWSAWLGGDNNEVSRLSQQLVIPSWAPVLSFWHYATSEDWYGNDFARVIVERHGSLTQQEFDLSLEASSWRKETMDLSHYAGLWVDLTFEVETNSDHPSSQFIDDITWQSDVDSVASLDSSQSNNASSLEKSHFNTPTRPQAASFAQDEESIVNCWYLDFKSTSDIPTPTPTATPTPNPTPTPTATPMAEAYGVFLPSVVGGD